MECIQSFSNYFLICFQKNPGPGTFIEFRDDRFYFFQLPYIVDQLYLVQ